MNRRTFLKLIGIGGAAAIAVPFAAVIPENQLNHRLEHICFTLGRWSRKRNVQIQRVVITDEWGHLVLDGKSDKSPKAINYNVFLLSDDSFHLADRNVEDYTKIVYCVEPRYLTRATELFVIIHVVNETAPHRLSFHALPTVWLLLALLLP